MDFSQYTRGIDVSHHKGVVNWAQVAAGGIIYSYTKATEGINFVDSEFHRNWFGLRQNRIFRGAYHFYRPNLDPVEQANHFIRIVGNLSYEFDMPPVIDVENSPAYVREEFSLRPPAENAKRIRKWLQLVESAIGKRPMIYTNQDTWMTSLGNDLGFVEYPLWIANYGVAKPNIPANNWGGRGWHFWQMTDKAVVRGVNRDTPSVDFNLFHQPISGFLAWMSLATLPPTLGKDVTNSMMFQAFQLTATKHRISLDALIQSAGLNLLKEPSLGNYPFDGPPLEVFTLSQEIKESLQSYLDVLRAGNTDLVPLSPMNSLSNQQIINGFYKAAARLGLGGWQLLSIAKLTALAEERAQNYVGPTLDQLPGLSQPQRQILAEELGIPDWHSGEANAHQTYPGVSNQMVINALYGLAAQLGKAGWAMVSRAGLERLVEDRRGDYVGPAIPELTGLTDVERQILANILRVETEAAPSPSTYLAIINQDVINAFYAAARKSGVAGWSLLERANLIGLAVTQEMRNSAYRGPRIEAIATLSSDEQRSVLEALNA